MVAISQQREDLVEALLTAGADIEFLDENA